MRINQFVARASGLSRRASDQAIASERVTVNGKPARLGVQVEASDILKLDGQILILAVSTTIMLNKPVGYVCSRIGQGSQTIYDLLPEKYQNLKPIGRLDKDSSGLLLLTNDGQLAQELTHPKFHKEKIYEVELDKDLAPLHRQMISDYGIKLDGGLSKLQLDRMIDGNDKKWQVTMSEGRNRQIRRTFASLGYSVIRLHRTQFGNYSLINLEAGRAKEI